MYKFKGAYDATAVYAVNDVVTFNDLAYRMVVATGAAGVTPCDDTNNWVPLSQDLTQACFMMAPDFVPAISTPQDGDVLVYDGTAGKWKNGEASGGGVTVVHLTEDEEEGTKTLDMKAGALYAACQQAPVFIQGYNTLMQSYKCELIEYFSYDESEGYRFNGSFIAQTADDYPAESGETEYS